jgi:hypothetical protein
MNQLQNPMTALEQTLLEMLAGGSDSQIAIAVGCAEGTRTKRGDRTKAWYGHTDPGNGARNLGSFSYQHEAASPEEADLKQIEKFKTVLLPRFLKAGLICKTHFAIACDVFTQSETACLARGGVLEQLKAMPCDLISARVQAYFDPTTRKLDAPGFGNNVERLRADQERRTKVVLEVIQLE